MEADVAVAAAALAPPELPIRVVIADDHPLFREGLRRLLETQSGFEVVGEAPDGSAAIAMTEALQPDLLLLDVAMPGQSGYDVLKALEASSIRCRVLLLTAGIDPPDIVDALELGARGVVLKGASGEMIAKAIRAVMKDECWIGRQSTSDLVRYLRENRRASRGGNRFGLTPRELQIVTAIVAGESNRDIARRFGLSNDTVKHHVTNVFDKTGVSNRVELALFAINHRLVERA